MANTQSWPPAGFSTGQGVTNNRLKAHAEGSLAKLAAAGKKPQVIPHTRAAYKKLKPERQSTLKRALPYFVGGVIKGARADGHVVERGYITLDVESKDATLPPAPTDVAEMCSLLGVAAWVYTSLNHTTDRPRYRVVMPLAKPLTDAGLSTATLQASSEAAAQWLGIPLSCVDPKSWGLSQPMFLPAKFTDGEFFNSGAIFGEPQSICTPRKLSHQKRDHADPVVDGLIKAGLYLEEDSGQPGKHYFTCPFHEEHANSNDTQTVYYERGSHKPTADPLDRTPNSPPALKCLDTAPDKDGKPHLTLAILKDWLRKKLGDEYRGFDRLMDFPDLRPGQRVRRERLAALRINEFLDYSPPDWLVPELIPRGEGALIQGQSGAGKSFFALDLACRLASGMPWQGRAVPDGLWVAYIAAEGSVSIRKRLQAWLDEHRKNQDDLRIVFFADTLNLADERECVRVVEQTLEATEGLGVGAFFIDTLARSTAGLNENTSEMGVPLRHLQGMSRALGGTPCTVHHLGKDKERGGRGWSGIHADMDTVLEVSGTGEVRSMQVIKQRDGEEGARFGFRIESKAESAVVAYCDAPAPAERPLSGEAARLHAVLESLNSGGRSIRLTDAQAAYHDNKVADAAPDKAPRRANSNQNVMRLLEGPVGGYVLDAALGIIRCPDE